MSSSLTSPQTPDASSAPASGHPTIDRFATLVRRSVKALRPAPETIRFPKLYEEELKSLELPTEGIDFTPASADEPAVRFTPHDHFGVALSGGGIRSATFNLGVLQYLARRQLLEHVDYLSTVSGGGYVGGFLTAWLVREQRRGAAAKGGERPLSIVTRLLLKVTGAKVARADAAERTPLQSLRAVEARLGNTGGDGAGGGECPEVRHLREFSRFLLPRIRIFQTDLWSAVMSVLGGLLPAFTTAIALLALVWYVWIVLVAGVAVPAHFAGLNTPWLLHAVPAIAGVAVAVFLLIADIVWSRRERANGAVRDVTVYAIGQTAYYAFGLLAAVGTGLAFGLLPPFPQPDLTWPVLTATDRGLKIPAAIGVCALGLLLLRVVAARIFRTPLGLAMNKALERCAARMVGLTLGTAALALLWLISIGLVETQGTKAPVITSVSVPIFAALFAKMRRWLAEPVVVTQGTRLKEKALRLAKTVTPKVLAAVTLLLLFVGVGVIIALWGLGLRATQPAALQALQPEAGFLPTSLWQGAALSAAVLVLIAFVFDPSRLGLHEMYRSRISRCYLGASNRPERDAEPDGQNRDGNAGGAARNRFTEEGSRDDLTLADLRSVGRPIHLVCAAANNLSGDPLGSLYRGARSAVLSGRGISLGNDTASLDVLRFSSALTASAAAFNSQMGSISMHVGPAVGFLMSALNLRLGLWLPHPTSRYRGRYLFPGRFYLKELLSRSTTTDASVHLSDGGHFENLALYELVRRHCRYILVADCGADPDVAFDDLGNALRRIREDFGVEVDLDISPLRPDASGVARQHAVVGTIHYHSAGRCDVGTILYFKPAITGDEPPDILQYRTRNRAFPHERTSDQFYDEAQWESYRRLGEHAAETALGFYEPPKAGRGAPVDRLFRDATDRWQAAPDSAQNFLELSSRCAAIDSELMTAGPERLRIEYFAETAELNAYTASVQLDGPSELQVIGFLTRVTRVMEDVWFSAQMEQYWSHPSNRGLMNWITRWATTPSFARWWPIIGPLYGLGFRTFVGDRFNLDAAVPPAGVAAAGTPRVATLRLAADEPGDTYFTQRFAGRRFLQTHPGLTWTGRRLFALKLALPRYDGTPAQDPLDIGFVLTREEHEQTTRRIVWSANELHVFEPLQGGGFRTHLLDELIATLRREGTYDEAQVTFACGDGSAKDDGAEPTAAELAAKIANLAFYASRGFKSLEPDDGRQTALRLTLKPKAAAAKPLPPAPAQRPSIPATPFAFNPSDDVGL